MGPTLIRELWIKKMGGAGGLLLPCFLTFFALWMSSILENIFKVLVNPYTSVFKAA